MYTDPDDLLPQHQHLRIVDAEELGERLLANKQVRTSRMEEVKLAKDKVNKTGSRGSEQTELEEEGRVDGESRESVEI